ncbi:MAG: hypothetical protein P4L46_08975 [Fimbriimonas sp.]|nr:hypothetical protein [Fimbriimonas sp.]
MSFRLSVALAALGLAAISLAAFDGITIKRTPKVGETHKYKQVGKFDVGGQEFDFEATSTEKVVKVEDSGNYAVEETQSDVKLNGQEAPEGAGTGASTTSYTAKGEVVEIKGDKVEPNTYRFANLALFVLPDKELKAGDTWSYDVKENKTTGAVNAKCSYTFVGEEKVGTTDAIKVKYTIKESGDDAASSDATVWLSKTDFTMLKLTAKWVNAPVPGAPMSISGDITLTLVP